MPLEHVSIAFDCTYLRAYFNRLIHRSRLLLCAVHSLHPFVSVFCVLFFPPRVWCLLSNYHSRVMISLHEAPALSFMFCLFRILSFISHAYSVISFVQFFLIFDCFLLCDMFLAWDDSRHTVILSHTLAHFDARGVGDPALNMPIRASPVAPLTNLLLSVPVLSARHSAHCSELHSAHFTRLGPAHSAHCSV